MIATALDKPFCQSCENNKDAILYVLRRSFARINTVLEIGSGTGQHAVHFARHLPHLQWQTSDLAKRHAGIQAWLDEAQLPNLPSPLELDVDRQPWAVDHPEAVFSANTLHIMSWQQVQRLFMALQEILNPGALVVIYGPFNYEGKYTSPSNRKFDALLKSKNPNYGIRDYEAVQKLARDIGLRKLEDNAMPSNNRLLIWQKI